MVFVKTHDIAELTSELIGKQVVLGGWIEDLRKLGKMTFITLECLPETAFGDPIGKSRKPRLVQVERTSGLLWVSERREPVSPARTEQSREAA